MPAFFDPTLTQAMDGGFIREGKIDEALQRLIPRAHILKSHFSYPGQAGLRDLVWMDQAWRALRMDEILRRRCAVLIMT